MFSVQVHGWVPPDLLGLHLFEQERLWCHRPSAEIENKEDSEIAKKE